MPSDFMRELDNRFEANIQQRNKNNINKIKRENVILRKEIERLREALKKSNDRIDILLKLIH